MDAYPRGHLVPPRPDHGVSTVPTDGCGKRPGPSLTDEPVMPPVLSLRKSPAALGHGLVCVLHVPCDPTCAWRLVRDVSDQPRAACVWARGRACVQAPMAPRCPLSRGESVLGPDTVFRPGGAHRHLRPTREASPLAQISRSLPPNSPRQLGVQPGREAAPRSGVRLLVRVSLCPCPRFPAGGESGHTCHLCGKTQGRAVTDCHRPHRRHPGRVPDVCLCGGRKNCGC